MNPRPRRPQETTRDSLLAVALRLFAHNGYSGTTIREVTALANANLGAVTYHFGTKGELYRQVLESVLGPLKDRVSAASRLEAPPLDRIEAMVRAIFAHIREHPEMPALMVRELASGQAPHHQILATFREALPLLVGMIRDGQRDGSIRDADPVLLALSTLAQPIYLNLARPVISRVAGVDPQHGDDSDRIVEHVAATVRAQLCRRP